MATETSTVTSYPTAYETSGTINGTRYRNAIGKGSDTSAVSGNDYSNGGSSSKAYIYYSFDFDSIPDNATIDSVECTVKGHAENTSRSTCNVQLYVGTSTAKGSSSKFTSTSAQTLTLTTGSWTVAEVKDMRLRFEIGYYGGLINGATVEVTYSWNATKWRITISNSTDVSVTSSDSEVYDGEDVTITAVSLDGITVTDNGTDVTSQFAEVQDTAQSYTVETIGDYGFELNSSTGYYVSENKGVSKTAAVCKVDVHVPVAATVTFSFINYAEQGYDFGVFGNLDETLSTNYYAAGSSGASITDSSYKLACNTSSRNTSSVQTLDYELTAGDHFIYVKYSKDDASDDNNDTLQFKVAITLDEPFTPGSHYEYVIQNVAADHAIVVTAGGPELYVKSGGAWVAVAKAYRKVGGAWQEVALGDAFQQGVNYRKA